MERNLGEKSNVSLRIVDRVAKRDHTDPLELPPLYDAVDPDALDDLFASGRQNGTAQSGRIKFQYNGYTVVVEFGNRPEITVKEGPERVE
ncbi:HalOD1 output domain-containing protein [Natrinema limicola]|uniref:HalOD1 output domain-containing protein n=1 Tax=Natrinema limicola TaxID=370323 RepID=UPI000A04F5DC|nr:HalOD1 output domain-containing protein [Natrinema limicola]